MSKRFKVSTVHGERQTVFHVVDTQAHADDQPAIVASYGTALYASSARGCACHCRDVHNKKEAHYVENR